MDSLDEDQFEESEVDHDLDGDNDGNISISAVQDFGRAFEEVVTFKNKFKVKNSKFSTDFGDEQTQVLVKNPIDRSIPKIHSHMIRNSFRRSFNPNEVKKLINQIKHEYQ